MVVNGDIAYSCNSVTLVGEDPVSTPGKWTRIGLDEAGGIAYNATMPYVIGDVVSRGEELFVKRTITAAGVTPVIGTTTTDWEYIDGESTTIKGAGVPGVAIEPAYGVGTRYYDTTNKTNYVCTSASIGANVWKQIDAIEVGGKLFSTIADYVIGDVVYYNTGTTDALYVCDVPVVGAWDPTKWTMLAPEIAGKNWVNTNDYVIGDIVSESASEIYIALTNNTNRLPSISPADWKEYGTASHMATDGGQDTAVGLTFDGGAIHVPDPALNQGGGLEYPSTALPETLGAIWIVSGLGGPYTMVQAGGSLLGQTLDNDDTLEWVSGATSATPGDGSEGWYLKAAPSISAERGGILYNGGLSYVSGDIVSEGGVGYIGTSGTPTGLPSATPSDWQPLGTPEKGGIAFDTSVIYEVGDVVVEADIAYFCSILPTPNPGSFVATDWTEIGTPEKGGIEYDIVHQYLVGDIVSNSGSAYRCITPNLGLWDVLEWETLEDSAGSIYDPSYQYETGDTVSYLDKIYIVGSTPPAPGTLPTDPLFSDVGPIEPERGGIAYSDTLAYTAGDIVTEGGRTYSAINSMIAGVWTPANWEKVDIGGTEWDNTVAYLPGDTVSNDGYVWTAVAPVVGTVPGTAGQWITPKTSTMYDATLSYEEGDVVTIGEDIFIAPAGGMPVGINPTLPATVGEWSHVNQPERGGLVYDGSGGTLYVTGDTMTNAGIVYRALTNEVVPGSFDPTEWENIDNDVITEVADEGAMTSLTPVKQGDVVYLLDTFVVYKATKSAPAGTLGIADWQPIGAINGPSQLELVNNGTLTGYRILYRDINNFGAIGEEAVDLTFSNSPSITKGATGAFSYASGINNEASGDSSNATGNTTVASGDYSHTIGWGTIAHNETSTASGKFNVGTSSTTIHETGIGTNAGLRVNAFEVHDDGVIKAPSQALLDHIDQQTLTTKEYVDQVERGGVAWRNDWAYENDDVTVDTGKLYRSLVAVSTIGANPAATPLEWELVNPDERGGLEFRTEDYIIGDVITYKGITYRCIADHAGVALSWDNTKWESIQSGGKEWDATEYYIAGDIAIDTSVIPRIVYVALQDNKGVNPTGGSNPADWQELDSMMYNATGPNSGDEDGDGIAENTSKHCPWNKNAGDPVLVPVSPNTIGEYPNTSAGDTIGAIWYISGIGYDADGERLKYTMTAGNLVGIQVKDGDHITWMAEVPGAAHQGDETWLLTKAPEISGERGGVIWSSAKDYRLGDIAVEADKIYVALTDNFNKPPAISTTDWALKGEPERGGVLFRDNMDYFAGDIIGIVDPTLPPPMDIEMRTWVCDTSHAAGLWISVKGNWSDTSNGGTY